MSSTLQPEIIENIYARFDAPITKFDCGSKCSPYNERGVPFCCDTLHAVPNAYQAEWQYLQDNTDLWHLWLDDDQEETARLLTETPDGMLLIECLGHQQCQRSYRSLTCRAFPFFPYIDSSNRFLGLSYYWEYEERCWVISHLDVVTPDYRDQFMGAYDHIFTIEPEELQNFGYHSQVMRQKFIEFQRLIPLIHHDGNAYLVNPEDEGLHPVDVGSLPKFGPYEIAALMPFPDER